MSQREDIEKYETELIDKDNKLEECHKKIKELHEKLKSLETENRRLLTQKSQEELERIQQKKQLMTLDLKHTTLSNDAQTDTNGLGSGVRTNETETCDTFHTANSDCSFASALPSPFPPRQEHPSPPDELTSSEDDGKKTVMSDSGVCLENSNNQTSTEPRASSSKQHPISKQAYDGDDNLSSNSSQNNNNFCDQILQVQMDKLREEIAIKKAEIMRILEMGRDKTHLDEMIDELQKLQKEYVRIEMRIESSRGEKF